MAGWTHIRLNRIYWFCHQAPERLRWRIVTPPGTNKLLIVMPHGVLDLKILGGMWVKKQKP